MKSRHTIRIGHNSVEWHGPFFDHMRDCFGPIDFLRWRDSGNWTENYTVLALVEGKAIVSTVGMTRMKVLVSGGEPRPALQFGAVATAYDYRGFGAARQLLEYALQEADGLSLPVILFANQDVIGFYPRFGFVQVSSHSIYVRHRVVPINLHSRRLNPDDTGDRDKIIKAAQAARPHQGGLSASPDGSTIIWHLFNSGIIAHELPEGAGVVCTEEKENSLFVAEWLTERDDLDLDLLALTTDRSFDRIELGFIPRGDRFQSQLDLAADPQAHLFVRHLEQPDEVTHFPDLVVT
ncbi:GNAT family N-acetyltransferase [Neorhizobium lilium]|uniref:GNAT family N-acetyltransferase n=1 Tax=Neorhizobium lilium TaxID=2503024 RepID=A0A3S3S4T9_9HYPH|nr:GNAT family N-acetyltransferase [Neorhizobium lilium]RWX76777.1 GNAT family N-acetyltransferase [Neorhizobium lilium]